MIRSRQELADFALRQLGGGVVNIEVTDDQIEDAIELTIQHYHEYHFDGIVRDYMSHRITGTQLTLDNVADILPGDTISSLTGSTTAKVISILGHVVTINRQIGYDKFSLNQQVINTKNQTSTTITSIVLGDIDNGWITAGDNIVGVTKILNITNILGSSDYMFNVQYQVMMTEIQALTKAGASTYWQTMNYLGHLDFIMKKEKNFTFNRRMNRLYLEISWGTDVNVGDIVVAEIYRAVDETAFMEVYDDIWVKNYTTALIKKQWGQNLKKYGGMQLPGGLTYDGQTIYNEAINDIKDLKDEALYSTSPLDFYTG